MLSSTASATIPNSYAAAKPARRIIKARPVKVAKDASLAASKKADTAIRFNVWEGHARPKVQTEQGNSILHSTRRIRRQKTLQFLVDK
jgi:hypothetical protein